MKSTNSYNLFEGAKKVLAEGVSSRARAILGGYKPTPIYIEYAKGSKIYDVDGNEYIDFLQALGPNFLGNANEHILSYVTEEIKKGTTFALGNKLEIKLAEKFVSHVPCFEKVGFVDSGTEAVQMVLEIARGYTGRNKIVKFEGHYHGWLGNVYVSVAPKPDKMGDNIFPSKISNSQGSPASAVEDTIVATWNNKESLKKIVDKYRNEIAAVIMEPHMANCGLIPPEPGYLKFVRELTKEENILLIFDEVITGYRLSLGGAQEFFGVIPDLADMGKICGGGFPLAVYGGKAEIMNAIEKVAHAGTLNANIPCLAASFSALDFLEKNRDKVYKHVSEIGNQLIEGINNIIVELKIKAIVQGLPQMFQIYFTDLERIRNYRELIANCREDIFNIFWERLLNKGILIRPRYFGNIYISYALDEEDVSFTLKAIHDVLKSMKKENIV